MIPFDPVLHDGNRTRPVYHGLALRSRWAHSNQPAFLIPSEVDSGLPECVVMRGEIGFWLVVFASGSFVRPCVGCAPIQIQKVPPYQCFGSECSCSFSPIFLRSSNTVEQTIELSNTISMSSGPEYFDLTHRVLLHGRGRLNTESDRVRHLLGCNRMRGSVRRMSSLLEFPDSSLLPT
jgi:hypothetical protein